uniref:Meiosis regulator and mRNA stability factor 1 n=1 Tax=Amphora coffeiformis TaxID=265554 RepID=A0A7S3L8A5_9STRA
MQQLTQEEEEHQGIVETNDSRNRKVDSEVFDDFPTLGPADVAVFWDYENVRIPNWCPATMAAEGIRNKVTKYGRIVEKRLYYDSRQPTETMAPRSDLDLSGFTLVDCPSRNRKETLDKKLIVDVLCFAWERVSLGAKACVVLDTSDGDYSYALARLRDIGVFTVIIYKPDIVAKVLIDNANVVMSWEFDVLGGIPLSQEEDSVEALEMESNKNSEAQTEEKEGAANGPPTEKPNSGKLGLLSKKLIAMATSSSPTSEPKPTPQTDEKEAAENGPPTEKLDPGELGPLSEKLIAMATTSSPTSEPKPTPQTRSKFALLCSVVLNAQQRNVKEGISVYSSWADEGNVASTFYIKVGEKDRQSYIDLRTLATQRGFVEWGRRNLAVAGKPVIKVVGRDDRPANSSSESYLRLTYSGLSVVNPSIESKEVEWKLVIPNKYKNKKERSDASTTSDDQASRNGKINAVSHGRLFVGGLAWQTTEDSMRSYFRQFGPLKQVVVMAGRGYGFLCYQNPEDAKRCLAIAGNHIVDRKLVE